MMALLVCGHVRPNPTIDWVVYVGRRRPVFERELAQVPGPLAGENTDRGRAVNASVALVRWYEGEFGSA